LSIALHPSCALPDPPSTTWSPPQARAHAGRNSIAGTRNSCDFQGDHSTKIQQRRFRSC
jgi:hypothetical protein